MSRSYWLPVGLGKAREVWSPPGVGIRTDLRGQHRMQRAHTNTNSMLDAHIRTLSADVCIAANAEMTKKTCQQPELICLTSSSVRECETTVQVCLYLSIFIKTACLSVQLWWMSPLVSLPLINLPIEKKILKSDIFLEDFGWHFLDSILEDTPRVHILDVSLFWPILFRSWSLY